ncbi:hypothetical protein A3C21_02320 [Candidatus Kaiserbacteria bacterium RIFCSPHIGHO2_02_FULL_59_21]|uniref:Uncharacterized protein n=1 Tax=Candidatus Kaiserbacteria bacterium RIFCSPHIGHO2_02_FULL_59_21 TaxID=1798500 RepID=A0A1F6E080_9BACT|nr:MAG: hypothetical protein A2766_04130 [Candidatus Kaiserbacteria bacterium RIFCSPHIGHO2_01_FULL_58_22]OGG67071.1 MAG: hypothetical protein A3C21_02320 [Candidatus Kaiserbacteria bacterium RIFCSPHIGHO2_02_FULL_59_21]OGG79473.1 MAG: hypothetical protein A2952_00210 [Candidatus Kaiserbacteria bacterium RIFCSPLOWO2_01_FULL_59_34]OGG86835.1 MAG: hypothetical protein A3I47_04180 [Candidatus Kaiserbacteria bacterium RIFCSPLOWO2_02_FULL_59_19]
MRSAESIGGRENIGPRIISPENPQEYLKAVLDKAPDFIYTPVDIPDAAQRTQAQEAVTKRREQLCTILPYLPDIAKGYADQLRQQCAAFQLDSGKIRAYLVGGRVRSTPLKERSDFDLYLTVENPGKGFQITRDDSVEVMERKRAAYDNWRESHAASDRMLGFGGARNLDPGLVEVAGFGLRSDQEFRDEVNQTRGLLAVLMYAE